jgi:hypothetical protein
MVPRRVLLSLLGAVILFVWGFAGHVMLRFYDPVYQGLADEAAVAAVLRENTPAAGLYYVPLRADRAGPPQAEAFINYVPAGERSGFGAMVARGLLINAAAVFLVLSLFAGLRWNGYWVGVGRFALAGLVIGFTVHAYYWNWFDFPGLYLLLSATDAVIGWTLVGLALVRLAGTRDRPAA